MKCRCHRSRLECASHLRTGSAVGRQVVQHDVDVEILGDVEVDPLEEAQHLGPAVTRLGVVEDLAGGDVHGGEQVGGSVPAVGRGSWRLPVPSSSAVTAGRTCQILCLRGVA